MKEVSIFFFIDIKCNLLAHIGFGLDCFVKGSSGAAQKITCGSSDDICTVYGMYGRAV
jgi:hypothetical protein